jgi:hypothetical protein
MYMLRDPWSNTGYDGDYDFESGFWTDDYKD